MSKKKLGKGLSALLGESNIDYSNSEGIENLVQYLDIEMVEANPLQPRKNFDLESIDELASSIAQYGILQPILVTKTDDSHKYIIIAGERRWRASKLAGLSEIPAIIKAIQEDEAFKISLIENLQREELNIIEEIYGYLRLIEVYNYTQEELSKILGKSRSHVTNILRLHKLPDAVKQKLINKEISTGHARALLSSDNAIDLADNVVKHNLSVRETENLIKSEALNREAKSKNKSKQSYADNEGDDNSDFTLLANSLSQNLNVPVNFEQKDASSGKLIIEFESLEELDRLLELLMKK
jgi:ParB family chromosome partitioning protein